MAKEQDQTQQTEEDKAAAVETKEDTSAVDAAVKTSEAFDKLADANPEDVEDTPSKEKDDEKKDSKDSKTKDDAKADDKDTGKADDKVVEKDTKVADDTGETKITELEQKALDYGLSEEEIGKFEDEAALKEYVDVLEKVMSDDKEDASAQAASDNKADDKKEDKKEDDKGTKLDEDVDPSITKAIEGLKQENKELREKLDTVVGGLQKQQQDQFIKRFDGYVKGLGMEFADTFGIGKYNDLGQRSQAYRNRQAVGQRMQAFGKGMVDQGLDLPDEQELFDLAVNSLHKKKVETVKGMRLGTKTTKRSKQRLGRSATKKTGKLTGDQKAIETSKKFDDLIDTEED